MNEKYQLAATGANETALNSEIANFLYLSFFFSQGNNQLQKCLIAYARQYYKEPLRKLRNSDKIAIKTKAAQRATSWVRRGPHPDLLYKETSDVQTRLSKVSNFTIRATINPYARLLTAQAPDPKLLALTKFSRELPLKTSRLLIEVDYQWLVEKGGRPNRKANKSSPFNDSFLSHAVYFGLLGQTTNHPAMDFAYSAIRPVLQQSLSGQPQDFNESPSLNQATFQKLLSVIAVYSANHDISLEQQALFRPNPTLH